MSPVFYTDIKNPAFMTSSSGVNKNLLPKLTDLFLNYDSLSDEHREANLFKVKFYCLRIDPQDPREIVQAMCPKCKECYSCKDLEADGKGRCKPCKAECRLVYKLQMLVKDASSQMNKNFYRIILFSGANDRDEPEHDVSGFFLGVAGPCNLYKNEEALHTIEKHIRNMLRHNVWIDALIERKGTYFLIKDTQIKIL